MTSSNTTENYPVLPLTSLETSILSELEGLSETLVWYTPSQIDKGEHSRMEQDKGIRAWSVSPATGQFLYDLVQKKNAKCIIELGTSVGYSTLWLGLSMKKFAGEKENAGGEITPRLFTIEKNEQKTEIATKYFQKSGIDSIVKLYEGQILEKIPEIISAIEMEKSYNKKADIIFFDADRSKYSAYLDALSPAIGNDTILVIDNAIDMKDRLEPFRKHLEGAGWKIELVDVGDGLWLCQK